MALTDLKIKNAKAGGKPYRRLSDGGGLYIEVRPSGRKTWFLAYRRDGKQMKVRGGPYSEMSLADARFWREKVKAEIRAGNYPTSDKPDKDKPSFETIAREWFELQQSKWTKRYADIVIGRLENDPFPLFGDRPIDEVSHEEILSLIERMEQREVYDLLRRTLRYVSRVMRYAIATKRASYNPVPDVNDALKPKPKTQHYRQLSLSDLPDFYAKLRKSNHSETVKLALQWTILTWARTSETRFFRPEEIEGRDTDELLWRVPADRMKMGREHLVPLPRQAGPLLDRIETLAQKMGSQWQFAQVRNALKPIDENVMLYCLYDLGYLGKATVHGFRGMASTLANEQVDANDMRVFHEDWIERQLAHVEENKIRGAYNAAEYLGPRRKMMQWWADFLEEQQGFSELL
ncbi:tyrosine-type recombinase/integrase [Alterisphingorhabdus coralli]|uniref:Integrase arm-type DNA-binding domain-containing protein n=1 Tax=Alterisphingorhabdus coralli TaxID=3071408 RepID=A0AA97I2E4_9SPHN|nr:integrase arm-type DNA-binding domain-containing protein [Parasphingorhabdus sp. SCSIO 66989]WOE76305.1 integrase arm-type DNA-binding domain-containing protein [Parasphingorhabdus sp. SCSIO 66989]